MDYRNYGNRTMADELRENPPPASKDPHVHFHQHDGMPRHSHEHIHWEGRSEHAHSTLMVNPPK